MSRVVLKRGWKEVKDNPLLVDILALMRIIEADDAEDGPPDMALEFFTGGEAQDRVTATLLFLLAFDVREPPLWLVQFILPGATDSPFLATHHPVSDLFVVRTSCGVVERFRRECLLERSESIEKAITYFLKHGEMCPSLTWLPYEKVVRDAE